MNIDRELGALTGPVAQSVEQEPFKLLVLGSSPSRPTSLWKEVL